MVLFLLVDLIDVQREWREQYRYTGAQSIFNRNTFWQGWNNKVLFLFGLCLEKKFTWIYCDLFLQ